MDVAERVAHFVPRRGVLDAVAELDDVSLLEPREVDVVRARRRIHRDSGVVRCSLAALDGLVDLAVLTIDARRAKLNDLSVSVEVEAELAPRRCGLLRERLEHHLVEAAREAVRKHRGDDEVPQGATRVALVRRAAHREKALGRPRVRLVSAQTGRVDTLQILAHVLGLRLQGDDLPEQTQLRLTIAVFAVQVTERAKGGDVFGRHGESARVGSARAVLLAERTVRLGSDAAHPRAIGFAVQEPPEPALGARAIATRDGELDHLSKETRVVEAQRRVASLDLERLRLAARRTQLTGIRAKQKDRVGLPRDGSLERR